MEAHCFSSPEGGGTETVQLLNAEKHWNKIISHFVSLHPQIPTQISTDAPPHQDHISLILEMH